MCSARHSTWTRPCIVYNAFGADGQTQRERPTACSVTLCKTLPEVGNDRNVSLRETSVTLNQAQQLDVARHLNCFRRAQVLDVWMGWSMGKGYKSPNPPLYIYSPLWYVQCESATGLRTPSDSVIRYVAACLTAAVHWPLRTAARHAPLCDDTACKHYQFSPVHTDDKVERTFDIRATKITLFRQSRPSWTCSTLATMSTATRSTKSNEPATVDFRQTGDKSLSPVCTGLYPLCPVTTGGRVCFWSRQM